MKYKHYMIVHNPKPIPDRSNDYDFAHIDYDGPEDTRCGNGSSVQDCKQQIDEVLEMSNAEAEALIELLEEMIWAFVESHISHVKEIVGGLAEGSVKAGAKTIIGEIESRLTKAEFKATLGRALQSTTSGEVGE